VIVEETANGESRERLREADLDRHLDNDKEKVDTAKPVKNGKNGKNGKTDEGEEAPRTPPMEFASKNDYQLNQAMNLLKAWQIIKR
jgi:carboxyl-terminal processing protease